MTPDLTAYFSLTATLPPVLLISTVLVLRDQVSKMSTVRQLVYGVALVGCPMIAMMTSVLSLLAGFPALRWVVFVLLAVQFPIAVYAYGRALFSGSDHPLG